MHSASSLARNTRMGEEFDRPTWWRHCSGHSHDTELFPTLILGMNACVGGMWYWKVQFALHVPHGVELISFAFKYTRIVRKSTKWALTLIILLLLIITALSDCFRHGSGDYCLSIVESENCVGNRKFLDDRSFLSSWNWKMGEAASFERIKRLVTNWQSWKYDENLSKELK